MLLFVNEPEKMLPVIWDVVEMMGKLTLAVVNNNEQQINVG